MKKINFLLTIALIILFLGSCVSDEKYNRIEGDTQGTTYHIVYNKDEVLKLQIDSLLADFDLSLSNFMPNSIISRINTNKKNVVIDNYFKTVFEAAQKISEATDGMFDITVGPLINAYGFGTTNKVEITDTLIDSLLQFVGYHKIRIKDEQVVKDDPGIVIDCNALAQGYAVDLVAEFLNNKGCKNYMIEIGGEVIVKGKNEFGEEWKIGIDKPIEDSNLSNREIQTISELCPLNL